MRDLRLAAAALLLVSACRPALPEPSPTPEPTITSTSRFRPYTGPLRLTLPPTWTPTFTPSPAPPTATRTATPTPTPSPTLSAADICAGLEVWYDFEDGARFRMDETLEMFFSTGIADVTIHFLAQRRYADDNLGVQLPGGGMFGMQLPLERLARPGLYDWTVTVAAEAYGDICRQGGYFFVLPVEPTPDATAEMTAEA